MRRGRSPFGAAAPSLLLAAGFGAAALLWVFFGDVLPGGRWFAVHLFTLGVLTNVVLTFSEHFSRTVTRTPGERAVWWPAVTNLGVLGVLVGLPGGQRWLLAAGASVVTFAVLAAWWRLRGMRRAAIGARFAWIVRIYERAHGAFVHGAVLGALLGIGVLSGPWYGAARLAHLHANLLGWGGLTLLATMVFFGPTMARTRIEDGADARAVRASRAAGTGLSIAVVLLLLSGAPQGWGLVARIAAAGALGVYAWGATVICLPVARAARAAKPSAPRPLIVAVCRWLPVVVWADVLVVATGAWRWLDTIGAAAILGVLAQAVFATLVYLVPMLRGRTAAARDQLLQRLEVGMRSRAVGFQIGTALVVLGASGLLAPLGVAAAGWLIILGVVGATAVVALSPVSSSPSPAN